MSTLSAEEMAMFNTDAPEDDWGFDSGFTADDPPLPVLPAPKSKLNFTDQSTRSDAEVKAERDRIAAAMQANGGKIPPVGARMSDVDAARLDATKAEIDAAVAKHGREHAQIIPPDAPANSADVPPPEKAKRGKKAAVPASALAVTLSGMSPDTERILLDIAEIKALLLSLIAR